MNIYKLRLDIKTNILKGKFTFVVKYKKNSKKKVKDIVDTILAETKNDLFLKQIEILELKNVLNSDYRVSILFKYNDIDRRYINEYLNDLVLESNTDYEKIKEIYDFMLENFKYNKYQKDFVCLLKTEEGNFESLSLLFSIICNKFNINNIFIEGFIGKIFNKQYKWNFVEIDSEWYNIDVALDIKNNTKRYFLLPDFSFENHLRDDPYITKEFYEKYPSAVARYGTKDPNMKYLKIKQASVRK